LVPPSFTPDTILSLPPAPSIPRRNFWDDLLRLAALGVALFRRLLPWLSLLLLFLLRKPIKRFFDRVVKLMYGLPIIGSFLSDTGARGAGHLLRAALAAAVKSFGKLLDISEKLVSLLWNGFNVLRAILELLKP
jgi:hypothetical protein